MNASYAICNVYLGRLIKHPVFLTAVVTGRYVSMRMELKDQYEDIISYVFTGDLFCFILLHHGCKPINILRVGVKDGIYGFLLTASS